MEEKEVSIDCKNIKYWNIRTKWTVITGISRFSMVISETRKKKEGILLRHCQEYGVRQR